MPLYKAWKKAYQSASSRWGPHLSSFMELPSMNAFEVFTSSTLSVSSSGLSPDCDLRDPFLSFLASEPWTFLCLDATLQHPRRDYYPPWWSPRRPSERPFCFPCRGSSQCSVGGRLHPLADSPAISTHWPNFRTSPAAPHALWRPSPAQNFLLLARPKSLFGCLQSYFSPQIAHHQLVSSRDTPYVEENL